MSKPEETPNEKSIRESKDEVTIGRKILKINRKVKWSELSELTKESAELEEFNRADKKDIHKIMEFNVKSDAWDVKVLTTCLVDFKEELLDELSGKAEVDQLAANVFWSVRSGISFLEMVSAVSSSIEKSKAKK